MLIEDRLSSLYLLAQAGEVGVELIKDQGNEVEWAKFEQAICWAIAGSFRRNALQLHHPLGARGDFVGAAPVVVSTRNHSKGLYEVSNFSQKGPPCRPGGARAGGTY